MCVSTELIITGRSSAESRLMFPSSSSASHQRPQHHQQQHQQPFVSARIDQFASRHQLSALQPVRPSLSADRGSGWLPVRKCSATDEDNLDRLVEINTRRLDERAVGTVRSLSAVRRPTQNTNVVPSSSTVYVRAKLLPVTNNVAKPFTTAGRNY